jgi:hypothetical protein
MIGTDEIQGLRTMSIDWILNQILHINLPTILVSIGGSWGARELVDWLKRRNLQTQQADMQKHLQSQKAEIDRQLEITKTECQRDIQTQYLQTLMDPGAFPVLKEEMKK